MTTPPDPRAEARALMEWCSTDPMRTENEIALCDALEAMLEREEQKDSVIEAARKIPVNAGNWLRGAAFYEDLRDLEAALEMYDAARREEPKP